MTESLITKHLDLLTSAIEAKSTAGRGSGNKIDLYGVKKLRELILALAVRGKLVAQNINEEPARFLLEKIKKKYNKTISNISEDNYPYIIPYSWEWANLTDVYLPISPSNKKTKTSEILSSGKHPVVDQGMNFISGYSDSDELLIKINEPVVVFGDHTRNIKYIDFDFVAGADGVKILQPIEIEPRYFLLQLKSYEIDSRGYGRHFKILNSNLFSVPPLAEQERIVTKVDELMALCDQLEQQTLTSMEAHTTLVETLLATLTASADADELAQNWSRISEHFDTLFTTEQSIDLLKQTILQLAVMGKLVPQDPTDEPASVLLEKIAAEKAQLIKDKKIKKEKPLPPISDDEKPFELPQGWAWCRFGELGYDMGGGTPSKTNNRYWGGIIPWISPKDMKCEYITSSIDSVTESAIDENTIKIIPEKSLLMVVRGMILAHSFPTALTRVPLVINQDMKALVFTNIEPEYLLKITQAMKVTFVNLVDRSSHGTCKLVSEKLWSVPMAIPPIKEQKRILDVVNGVLGFAENLKQIITEQRKHKLKLSDIFSMQPYDI